MFAKTYFLEIYETENFYLAKTVGTKLTPRFNFLFNDFSFAAIQI